MPSQQIVEVVRNASRQPSDDLHLLRFARFLSDAPCFRRVLQHRDQERGLTPDIVYCRDRHLTPQVRSIFAKVLTFLLEGVARAALQLLKKCFVWLKVARM